MQNNINIGKMIKTEALKNTPALKQNNNDSIPKKELIFNHSLLPRSVAPWVYDVANRMDNAPVSFAGIGALVVLSSAIGRRVGVRVKLNDDWTITPNLWGALIAPPSIHKSPILEEMIKPLKKVEMQKRESYELEVEEYKKKKTIYDIKFKAYKKEIAQGDEEKAISPSIEKTPTQTRYILNDATIEKVGEIMIDNPKGVLVAVDELSGFFSTFNKAGREGDRSFWLTAFNGDNGIAIDRIGRGSSYISSVCASIIGTIQPSSITKLIEESQNGAGDGLLQRFQLIAIEMTHNNKIVDRKPNYIAKEEYENIITKMLDVNPLDYGAKRDKDKDILFYRFSPEANKVFNDWSLELNNKIIKEQTDNPSLGAHLGKFKSLFGSLALILFYADRLSGVLEDDTIPKEYVLKAIELCDYFEYQAHKFYDIPNLKEDKDKLLTDKILKVLKTKGVPITYSQLSVYVRGANVQKCRTLLSGYVKEENNRIVKIL